jgi:hypothetical protein
MLRPNEKAQHEMVINGLTDILMRAADGEEAVFCLPGANVIKHFTTVIYESS